MSKSCVAPTLYSYGDYAPGSPLSTLMSVSHGCKILSWAPVLVFPGETSVRYSWPPDSESFHLAARIEADMIKYVSSSENCMSEARSTLSCYWALMVGPSPCEKELLSNAEKPKTVKHGSMAV